MHRPIAAGDSSPHASPRCLACRYPIESVHVRCPECGRDRASQERLVARRQRKWWLLALSTPLVAFAALVVTTYSHMEAYCFFYPSIDTRYAPGYSEEAFASVTPGMSAQSVEQLLGKPLFVIRRNGSDEWWYSDDGAAPFGDWAWFGRAVVLRNGVVTSTESTTFYD